MSSSPDHPLVRTAETADRVFDRLIDAIITGVFPGGQVIREARIAATWSVSRTPLREAVRRAAEAGFVILRPNQAPVVRLLSGTDVEALYGLRAVLECYALTLAWPRLHGDVARELAMAATAATPGSSRTWRTACLAFDRALHASWSTHCGNSWLQTDLQRQHCFLRIFQTWVGRDDAALRAAYTEHTAILAAIRADNLPGAQAALQAHIRTSAAAVTAALPTSTTSETA